MTLKFQIYERNSFPKSPNINTVYLERDNWNDYSFVTLFHLTFVDENQSQRKLGNIRIGFIGQTIEIASWQNIETQFSSLPEDFFSQGSDVEYYEALIGLPDDLRASILIALKDVVYDNSILETVSSEQVFITSLNRDTDYETRIEQFRRVLNGQAKLTDYEFSFNRKETEKSGKLSIDFKVVANSKPSTNIQVLIGRNGVGKTTILKEMLAAKDQSSEDVSFTILANSIFDERQNKAMSKDYFPKIVVIAFSAFDTFLGSIDTKNKSVVYTGLRSADDKDGIDQLSQLHKKTIKALREICSELHSEQRLRDAIKTLESDSNFSNMGIAERIDQLVNNTENLNGFSADETFYRFLSKMSSGHAIVFITIVQLVAHVEEKTLVLLDEPETHLHPPLLSAFIRALSNLLHNRNGVAICATHSPVVLQEVPKSCVHLLYRAGTQTSTYQPTIETFGENVGTLTREVFQLEVSNSGFYSLLKKEVDDDKTYDEILTTFNQQLGLEGRSILRALISARAEEINAKN